MLLKYAVASEGTDRQFLTSSLIPEVDMSRTRARSRAASIRIRAGMPSNGKRGLPGIEQAKRRSRPNAELAPKAATDSELTARPLTLPRNTAAALCPPGGSYNKQEALAKVLQKSGEIIVENCCGCA